MSTNMLKITLLTVIMILASLLLGGSVFAEDFSQHKIVNGVAIYFGVMPAEMILDHAKYHTEAEMHGRVNAEKNLYHVTFAFFDAESGKRISDMEAKARVSALGQLGIEKKLEPMRIANTISYGNYFKMPGMETYRILVQVRRPGVAQPIEAEFEYRSSRI